MVVGGILVLALTSQFIAMARFKTTLENKADPSREAYIVLNHMAHVLRFAKTTPLPAFLNDDRLTFNIDGGHIALVPLTTTPPNPPNDIACRYRWSPLTNCLYFRVGTRGVDEELSKYVTYFHADINIPKNIELLNPDPPPATISVTTPGDITLELVFSKDDTITSVQTTIKVLGVEE